MKTRVREIRKNLNLSGAKFGECIGVTKHAISQIETGKNKLTEQMIKSICREFSVSEKWLRTGEGDMFTSRTKEGEIAKFFDIVLETENDSFMREFIIALATLDIDDWKLIERFITKIIEAKKEH